MRILYIIPSFQHPKVRGSDRHYHFIRELSKTHKITLLTLETSEIHPEAMQEMASYVERIFTFDTIIDSNKMNFNPKPSSILNSRKLKQLWKHYTSVKDMKKVFRELVKNEVYDLIIFHGKSVFPVIEDWNELPIVIDFCDATSMRVQLKIRHAKNVERPLLRLRYRQIKQVEQKMLQKTPHIAFITSRDREAVLGSNDKSVIIPNGMDLSYWTRRSNNPQPNSLIFSGVMSYKPNEDAAIYLIDEILPHLRESISNLEVYIVGRDPSAALLARVNGNPEVRVTGFVDDMRDYLERAMVFVAPVRFASGMQNKIQEALAMEVPVVTTSIVAAGVRSEDGGAPPLYIADSKNEFAESVITLLNDESERVRLATEGRSFVEKHYDWARSARQLEQMCFNAIVNNVSSG